MYNTGTVTTTANSTKLVGTGTKWLNNINRVSAEQAIQIQINNTVYNNSIQSIQSDTELTLNFPLPTAATGAKYVILTTMVHSISDAMNKITAMQVANVQFSDILMRWMTEQGIITVTLPDQTTQQLRTTKEMDKQLDGKFSGVASVPGVPSSPYSGMLESTGDGYKKMKGMRVKSLSDNSAGLVAVGNDGALFTATYDETGKYIAGGWYPKPANFMVVGDYGFGSLEAARATNSQLMSSLQSRFFKMGGGNDDNAFVSHGAGLLISYSASIRAGLFINDANGDLTVWRSRADIANGQIRKNKVYTDGNTTKDSNGNLKAASPVVKLFSDDIELNDESEGVEMEHLGVGHYLIKGVMGFNADGAWGINNGFVIPQDRNGKNMVLIDYEVRPDGDIEIFVFHQQNADMPERFQNKRIKHFDEGGMPVYFENYEPCDVPESRWIDMRVEMPSNSIYNQKQAEAERLAKEEAERQAEEAKNAEIEAEEDI